MIINRNNYESYLVDFAEGVLSKELVPEMERFLLLNPDIKEEFDLFNDGLMDEFSIEFPEKNRLKQIPLKIADASSKEFQHFCVAYVEGWMTEQEKSVFEKAIQKDLVKEQELKLFQQSILPDVLIGFDEKVLLKPNEQNPKITQENFESYCIGCVEGWLNQKQMIALNNYVMLETKRRSTLEFYKKLKL